MERDGSQPEVSSSDGGLKVSPYRTDTDHNGLLDTVRLARICAVDPSAKRIMTFLTAPAASPGHRPRPLPSWRQLMWIGLITIGMMSAGWVGLVLLERRFIAVSGAPLVTMAAAVASNIESLLDQRYREVQTMAGLVASSPLPSSAIEVFRRTHPSYGWIGFVDGTGHVSYATDPATVGQDVRQRQWYLATQGAEGLFVRDTTPDPFYRGCEAVTFSAAVASRRQLKSDAPKMVLSTCMGVRTVEDVITRTIQHVQRLSGMTYALEYQIVRRDGSVFIDSDLEHQRHANLQELGLSSVRLAASGMAGFVEEDDLPRHRSVVTGYARLRADGRDTGLGWVVLVRANRAEVLGPITTVIRTVAVTAVLLTAPLMGLLIWAIHKGQVQWQHAEVERSRSRRNERRLQTILEADPDGMVVLSRDHRMVQVNPAACTLLAAAFPEEVLGQDLLTFIHSDDRDAFARVHEVALQGRCAVAKGRLTGLSGQVRWVDMISVLLPDDAGMEPSVLGVVRDVTEQRRSDRRQALQHAVANVLAESTSVEQALPELLRVVTTALEGQLGLFWLVDHTEPAVVRCLYDWSPSPATMAHVVQASRGETFRSGEGLPGRCWARGEPLWMTDALQESGLSRGPAAAHNGLHTACAFPIWLRASVYGVIECFSSEVQAADPDVLRTLGIIGSQIGLFIERTEVEAALRENESRTRLIIDTALDAVITVDSAGLITEWNAQAEQMFGWSSHEVIGRDLTETIIPPGLQEAHRQGFTSDVRAGAGPIVGRLVEWTARHRGGEEFPVEISIAPLELDGTVIFSAFIRNIASRKEAERSLTSYAERLERSNRELDVALAQAQAATEAKSAFLATMSHEIRTPMNGIIGMTGLLLDTALTPEQREYGQTVRRCGDHLLMLINDILDFSKIEAGKLSLERIPFDPRLAIEESLEILAERASSKGLNLASLFHADVPRMLMGDPGRLRQIVMNLVGNAIKFTEQGEVVIQVALETQTERDATIRITVSDSGIGITEDVQQRLFQSFSQADASTTRKYGGTGLGLAICKRLVELMQGSIGVTSRPGYGSSFWFTVTLGKPADVPSAASPAGGGLAGVRVLIVDDKVTNRSVMEQLTRRWGMQPVLLDGGASLRRILDAEAEPPACDVVLLDVDVEADDAVELGKAIKRRPQWETVPVVLLTSVGRRGDAGTAREAGFSAYLTKPIREAQLYDGLMAVMKAPTGMDTIPSLVTRHTVAEAQVHAGLRILVAEDNIINQKVAVRLFERLGYRVDVVASGLEAVEALQRVEYGLVFMDCQMPHMDGFQATMAIRTSEAGGRHTPIVAMTANTMQGDRERCLAAGMDDYVSKPITREAVQRVLERLLPVPTDRSLSGDAGAPALTPSMDWLIFNELRELAGTEAPDFLATLVGHFLHDTPASLTGMERALEARNFVELARLAHRLKGSAGHLGALRMTHCCDQIQVMVKEAQTAEACAQWIEELKTDFVQVQAALAKEIGPVSSRPLGPAATT